MRLYYAPGTCALACWISLEWAGADYTVEQVDPQSSSYRAINPLGMVPAIDIGRERLVTQADAILHFIAECFPDRDLGPDQDTYGRLAFDETMSFLTGDFHPAFWPYFVPQRFTTDEEDAALSAVRDAAYPRIARVLDHLDVLLSGTGYVYRERRTVADAYAFVMARWSANFPGNASWKAYPHLTRFMDRMMADDAVLSVLEQSSR